MDCTSIVQDGKVKVYSTSLRDERVGLEDFTPNASYAILELLKNYTREVKYDDNQIYANLCMI